MKARILGVALTSSIVALLLLLIPLAVAVLNLFLADARAGLEREALHAAIIVDPTFSAGDQTEIPAPPAGEQLGLYGTTGKLVVGTGPATAGSVVSAALGGSSSHATVGGWLTFVMPLTASENVTGAVRAAIPLATIWQRVLLAWLAMAVAASFAVAVGVIAARSLGRKITRPMEKLTAASQTLGQGDFTVRTVPSGLAEVDQAGAALNATAQLLGELVARERQLAANSSHQLRTPLTGLRAVLERAFDDPNADMRAAVEQAIERTDRLESTIEELISLNRGGVAGSPLSAVVELDSAQHRWAGVFATHNRQLHVDVHPGIPQPIVAEAALQQIFDALIENALRHGSGVVTLRAREAHNAVAFDIEDEGHGVPADEDIFQHGVSTKGGSGLGLAFARQLAGDQRGRLLLSERLPRTRFTLLLPALETTDADPPDGVHAVPPVPQG